MSLAMMRPHRSGAVSSLGMLAACAAVALLCLVGSPIALTLQVSAQAATASTSAGDQAARLAVVQSRPVKAYVACSWVMTDVELVQHSGYGSCVQDTVECPGADTNPNMISVQAACTALNTGVKYCCDDSARLPGVVAAEQQYGAAAAAAAASDQAQKAAAAAAAASSAAYDAAVAAAAPIFAKYPTPIACKGQSLQDKFGSGVCVPSSLFCDDQFAPPELTTNQWQTCGQLTETVTSFGQPVCCMGNTKLPPVPAGAVENAAAVALASRTTCQFQPDPSVHIRSGYCSLSEDLCPSSIYIGQSNLIKNNACANFGPNSVCCGDPEPPPADLGHTVCPMPSYSSFLEMEVVTVAEVDAEADADADAEEDAAPVRRLHRLQRTAAAPKKAAAAKPGAKKAAAATTKVAAATKKTPTISSKDTANVKAASPAAQKQHCADERRIWLAGKAKKGDQQAINELMRMGKTNAPKGTATAPVTAKKPVAPAKKLAVAKKAARFAQRELQP